MAQAKGRPGFYRGDEGRRRAAEELERDKQKQAARKEQQNAPFRFRISPDSTTQFIVVDDEPDFYRFEHNLKNPATGFWDIFTGCVAEWDNCPVCEAAGKDPYYALYLTVIDLTPFKTKDGVTHDFSRKLLVVKPAQQKKFNRLYNKFAAEGLSLRGALFETTRDSDKDSAIGNEIEYLEHVPEEELVTYVREWTDREKKKHTEDCAEPYDYEKLFEAPDTEKLRAFVGGKPTPGSRAHDRDALQDDAPRRGSAGGTRRGRAGSGGGDDDADWAPPPSDERMTPRRTPRAEPDAADPPARTRRGARPEPEDAAPARPGARRATARRAADDPPFDPDADSDAAGDDEPRRPAARRPLRR